MTSNLLYAVGTLLSWVGWAFALAALVEAARLALLPRLSSAENPGREGSFAPQARLQGPGPRKLLVAALVAGVCLLLCAVLPMNGGADSTPGAWRFPLVWFVMPWTAWLGTASLAMLVVRGAQAGLALNATERSARLRGTIAWGLAAVVFAAFYYCDPVGAFTTLWKGGLAAWLGFAALCMALVQWAQARRALNSAERSVCVKTAAAWGAAAVVFGVFYVGKFLGASTMPWGTSLDNAFAVFRIGDPTSTISTLKGGIAFAPTTAFALLLLAVAAVFAMVLSARSLATRGLAKAAVVQATLVLGSFVFGLPFAFAIVTSFKEDRDMSSPNGIVWVPRVSDTVPYLDPTDPLYEGRFNGDTVQGHVIPGAPAGEVRVDIQKPLAIRGTTYDTPMSALKQIPVDIPLVRGTWNDKPFEGRVVKEEDDGRRRVAFTSPPELVGKQQAFAPADVEPIRHIGLKWQNYPDAISYLPPETHNGIVYLKNTLVLVIFNVVGTVLSSSLVAYAFSRMRFPGKDVLFTVLLATMMLPGAVTLMPRFLIFRSLGWIDTLYPLWVPAFFASAFNVFLLRQFFMQIPMELEDASKIDGCGYLRAFWKIMLPQIKPALAVIAIWTFMGAWNDFMGPLIYVSSPENMPLSYALKIFQGDRGGEPGMLMALTTLSMIPVLALFFFAQRYFIEGVTLSGLGGR